MFDYRNVHIQICMVLLVLAVTVLSPPSHDVALPAGVRAVWDVNKAYHETTPTRDRVCLNGLWRWQPAAPDSTTPPGNNWGFFKVPGSWPGITSYDQKDCQKVYCHPSWQATNLSEIRAAWYEREFIVPEEWGGRRIALSISYLNSFAAAYVDGKKIGDLHFPADEIDLTAACRPGATHLLSLLTIGMPLNAVMMSYSDTASAKAVAGSVDRRGLCGDLFLVSKPVADRIADIKIDTSVRHWNMTVKAALQDLQSDTSYRLHAVISEGGTVVEEFSSSPFKSDDVNDGTFAFVHDWQPRKLWDVHTPENQYDIRCSLADDDGKVLDSFWNVRFGFREFWIDGRDFYLNGTRIYCSSVPLDNAQVGAALANYDAARESLLRLKSFGVNLVYTHNYGCEPGSHLSFDEILRAADDVGMLVSLSQPHFSHYDWEKSDAGNRNGYARHAAFYVRVAGNHPSVVMYAMSHNATVYTEDMNPDLIDGIYEDRDSWSSNNSRRALRAEAIVKQLDPNRIIYHHASGNLSSMHTINFYANFVPIQERSDWFEHWATKGVKPLFLCEYGIPISWNWTMYRGWYKGEREFGSAVVPWEYCLAEWNAQFLGDRAYRISEKEKDNLRWEAKQFRAARLWHRWDYPHQVGSLDDYSEDRDIVWAMHITDNWRAFRTWGVSAFTPWDYDTFWKRRDGLDRRIKRFDTDWDNLQRPGLSLDYIDERYERMDLAFERSDWIPTNGGRALIRNNQPLLAYIGGKPSAFTEKGHNYLPGEIVEKQLIVINNSRRTTRCECSWMLDTPNALKDNKTVDVHTGDQTRLPLRFTLSVSLKPGVYKIRTSVSFDSKEKQNDEFEIHVLQRTPQPKTKVRIALFDPKGETAKVISSLSVRYSPIDANADLSQFEILIIGKKALECDGPCPDLARVRNGLKVIQFEQSADVLERRLGFRVQEYGLRQVFGRTPGHPILEGLQNFNMRDWRGDATLVSPRLKYYSRPRYGPTIKRAGIEVTRPWRCGSRGNVASVLIEKPARGDFLPLVDGGYSLQYSPLLEYREGKGLVVFCQMDVTGRTEIDPAATLITNNLLSYVDSWKPSAEHKALYAGDPIGRTHLENAGFVIGEYRGEIPTADTVLLVSPGGGKRGVRNWLSERGKAIGIGLDTNEARSCLSDTVRMEKAEYIASFFEPAKSGSPFRGIGPADVHNRDPREISLITSEGASVSNGVLGWDSSGRVVFCQLAPWQFDVRQQNTRRTFRRTSCLLTRLLCNMGIRSKTPLLERFSQPVTSEQDQRWLHGLYLDTPEEWDDPYRFFRW